MLVYAVRVLLMLRWILRNIRRVVHGLEQIEKRKDENPDKIDKVEEQTGNLYAIGEVFGIPLVNLFADRQPHVKKNEDTAEHVRAMQSGNSKIAREISAVPRPERIDAIHIFLLDLDQVIGRRDKKKMRSIVHRIVRVEKNWIDRDLIFLRIGIVQRFVVFQMARDLDSRLESFRFTVMVAEILFIFFARFRFNEGAEVLKLLRPLEIQFNEKENQTAANGGEHVPPVSPITPHFQGGPSQDNRYRA